MASDSEYIERVRKYNYDQVLELWQQVQSRNTPDWDPGKALEYLILKAFELEEADVTWPFGVKLTERVVEQIDCVIYSDGLSCLVECKDKVDPINIEPIAKLHNQLIRRPSSSIGIVFSFKGFTAPALELASYLSPQTILLWNGEELEYALNRKSMRRSLLAKYRYAVEWSLADYDIRTEDLGK